jgi:putative membrane protein
LIGNILCGVVALIHAYIVVLEMLLWDTERGRKTFGTTPAFAAESKVLAANQGLYNGFLVAGLYGAATVGIRILLVQALPAVLALLAVLFLPS